MAVPWIIPPLPHVRAHQFERVAEQGSTEPLVFEAANGVDYLVKTGSRSLPEHVSELIAALLAPAFGVLTPPPAILGFHPQLLDLMEFDPVLRPHCHRIRQSGGTAFGSRWDPDAVSLPEILPVVLSSSDGYRERMSKLFTFDLFLGNSDRTQVNPNLLLKNDILLAIDHAQGCPWLTGGISKDADLLREHIANSQLLAPFPFPDLDLAMLENILNKIPAEWQSSLAVEHPLDSIQERIQWTRACLATWRPV